MQASIDTHESNQITMLVNLAVNTWNTQNSRVSKLLNSFTEEQWLAETAPGRNRGIYLLGHLIAVTDGLFPLFGIGAKLFPTYEQTFLTNADKVETNLPSLAELKDNWE